LLQAIEAGYPEETIGLGTIRHDVTAVALTPDAKRVVVASWSRVVLAQLEPLVAVHEFAGHTSEVTAVAVTPDGARMVSGSRDRTLRVWDLASGALLITFEGHADLITAIARHGDSRVILQRLLRRRSCPAPCVRSPPATTTRSGSGTSSAASA
jgi:WD40 repeat protein